MESEEEIVLKDVPIVTPNRDVVVSSLSFEVSPSTSSFMCLFPHIFLARGRYATFNDAISQSLLDSA